jgi:hypothetical protein
MTHNIFCLTLCLSLIGYGPCAEPSPVPPELWGTEKALTSEKEAVAPSAPSTPTAKTNRVLVRPHSNDAISMRKAAIAGQLLEFQYAAAAIASDDWSPPLRDDDRPHVAVVRDAALGAVGSKSLSAATASLGVLGVACAKCHQAVSAPPISEIVSAPAHGDESMLAHAAAEGALWQGLVFTSDESWLRGARALVNAPALDSDVADVSALAHRTRELAGEASAAPRGTRGESYGKILATCSGCHSRLGVKPE